MNEPQVDISIQKIDELGASFGRLCRAFHDFDKEIYLIPHIHDIPSILVATLMLDKRIGGDFLQVAFATFLDISLTRSLLPYSPRQIDFPAWDKSTLKHPELTPLYDICIGLAAFNLAAEQDELPPEMFVGPCLSLSGFFVDAVDRGFFPIDEEDYEQTRQKIATNHGSKEEFIASLKTQLESIEQERIRRDEDLKRRVN